MIGSHSGVKMEEARNMLREKEEKRRKGNMEERLEEGRNVP